MRYRTAAIGLAIAACAAVSPAIAQGLNSEGTIDAIVGSQVEEKERPVEANTGRVVAAIEKSAESAAAVRKLTQAQKVEIIFLPEAAAVEGGPPGEIEAKLAERKDDVQQLRKEIEGNALLYHAIDSRQVIMRDILAVELDADGVVVYAAAKPAG